MLRLNLRTFGMVAFLASFIAVIAVVPNLALAADQTPSLSALLEKADIAAGEQLSHRCMACHTFEKDGANKVGPNLWNMVGNARAHSADYNYSDALKNMRDKKWTVDALNQYLADPRKFAPGDKMSFPGIKDPKERADLIAYMRTLSDEAVK